MEIKERKIKTGAYLKTIYLISLVIAFFYVKAVLDEDSFKATPKMQEKPAEKVREVTVKLIAKLPNGVTEYQANLKNVDSVNDFLAELRDNQGFLYESDLYTYGTNIVSVDDKEADSGKKWAVIVNDKDITPDLSNYYLSDNAVFTILQIKE